MIIVIDTNIWLSELGLRSSLGSAVRYFSRQKGAKIGIPEIVKLEAEVKLRKQLNELIENILKNHRQLLAIFGELKEVVLPNEEQIEERVSSLFTDLGLDIIEIPFSLESARDSFLKTIFKEPPSDKSQQFKDGVLWADCVSLLSEDDVYLVTSDKAFFKNRKYEDGLSDNLKKEIEGKPHKLVLLSCLSSLLNEIQEEVTLDADKIFNEFVKNNKSTLNNILDNNGFSLGNRIDSSQKVFATENPDILFFEFEIKYECIDERDENRSNAILTLRGDGKYNIKTEQIIDMRNFGESLEYRVDGAEKKIIANQVIIVGNIVIGHRTVTHSVKYPLNTG